MKRDRERVLALASGVESLPQVAVHNIPCRVEHDGPARVSAFFQPKTDAAPSVDLATQEQVKSCLTVSFRGRELCGVGLGLPAEMRGLVIEEQGSKDGDDTEDDLLDEVSEAWDEEDGSREEAKRPRVRRSAEISAGFSQLTYWQREKKMTLDSTPIQWLTEWLPLNFAANQPITLEQMQAIDLEALSSSCDGV